jgi:AcrR family transcriptional regulator
VTWPGIRKAAIQLLYSVGFDGMNLRELSGMVGLQAGSLYNYFATKEDLLFRLISELMDELNSQLEAAVAEDDDPVEQLKRIIEILVIRHSKRRKEVYIGHIEMRSLTKDRYKVYVEKRDRTEQIVHSVLAAGINAGKFSVPDAKIAVMAIFTMVVGIADWYRPNGRMSVQELTDTYTEMILKLLQPAAQPAAVKSVAKPRKRTAAAQA